MKNKNVIFCYEGCGQRACQFTYHNYINTCGFSGTCAVTLEIARKLCENGNNVIITGVCDKKNETSEFDSRLKYMERPSNEDLYNCDLFVFSWQMAWPYGRELLARLGPKTIVCGFSHMFWSGHDIVCVRDIVKSFGLKFVYIVNSKLSKLKFAAFDTDIPYIHVNNSISSDVFKLEKSYDVSKKKDASIFPTTYNKGGYYSEKITKMCGKEFVHNTYLDGNTSVSLGKKQLKKMMYETDYFIYCQCFEGCGDYWADTYCNAIHEALACGVLVVTYDVGCLRGVYGDNLVFIDPPDYSGFERLNGTVSGGGHNPLMTSDEYINKFVEKIKYLDSNPSIKNNIRKKAQEWALSNTYDLEYENFIKIFNI